VHAFNDSRVCGRVGCGVAWPAWVRQFLPRFLLSFILFPVLIITCRDVAKINRIELFKEVKNYWILSVSLFIF